MAWDFFLEWQTERILVDVNEMIFAVNSDCPSSTATVTNTYALDKESIS